MDLTSRSHPIIILVFMWEDLLLTDNIDQRKFEAVWISEAELLEFRVYYVVNRECIIIYRDRWFQG
jgi:hypothetical protein